MKAIQQTASGFCRKVRQVAYQSLFTYLLLIQKLSSSCHARGHCSVGAVSAS